mgnify:CR=1 FL=1
MSRIYYNEKKGTYYGEKIIEEDVLIFSDDEEINRITEKVIKSLININRLIMECLMLLLR